MWVQTGIQVLCKDSFGSVSPCRKDLLWTKEKFNLVGLYPSLSERSGRSTPVLEGRKTSHIELVLKKFVKNQLIPNSTLYQNSKLSTNFGIRSYSWGIYYPSLSVFLLPFLSSLTVCKVTTIEYTFSAQSLACSLCEPEKVKKSHPL